MNRTKTYRLARFSPETLQEAVRQLLAGSSIGEQQAASRRTLYVEIDDAEWDHDSEAEFFSDYRRARGQAEFGLTCGDRELKVRVNEHRSAVSVRGSTRSFIQAVFEVFEAHLDTSMHPAPPAPKPRLFIGHGRSDAWRELKDHLQDKHAYDVEAYEIGARAGHAVRDILEEMLRKSAFAVLVMTGEDDAGGELRARQNVVHEAPIAMN